MVDLLMYAAAYLLGTIPTGNLLKKLKLKSKPFTWIKLGLDFLKGAVVVSMAHSISPKDEPDWVLAGFLAMMGDEFPFQFKFKAVRGLGVTLGVFGTLLFWLLRR